MEITEIKTRLSIETLLHHYHLIPDKHHKTCCPFHAEDTPSFTLYPKTNTFHCFGCGASGDAIEFIQRKENLTKHAAILKASDFIGLPASPQPKPTMPEPPQNFISSQEREAILTKIFESFKNGLNHPVSIKPKEYLKTRNLNPQLLEIGYNSGQFHHHGKLSETDQKACIATGILIPYHGSVPHANGATYTAFAKDCIIFPLKEKNGNIISLYGRSIMENDKSKHFYLKDRQGLYPGYPKPETTRLILTEAIIDAATLVQNVEITDHYSVLSCFGTNGLTLQHRKAIDNLKNLQEIVFFFDGDTAGRDAVQNHHTELLKELPGVTLSTVETPENEDINSLLQGHDPEILIHLLENRKNLFLLSEEKKEFVSELKPSQEVTKPVDTLNTRNPEFITYTTQELQIVILGGVSFTQLDRLRLTVKISRVDPSADSGQVHNPLHAIRHTLDLYHADYLDKFIGKASEQLEISTTMVKRALAELTEQLETYRQSKLESLKTEKPRQRELTEEARNRAIRYLKAANLMQRTGDDIAKTGVIGEETNRLLMYLIFTSRLRDQPLHIVSLGASGTGKTHLQEKVSQLIPQQDRLEITILSENAFYYFDRTELQHKLVLIEDMDGAQEVLYPLRELQTKRKISKTLPLKDNKGNLRTITLHVEGPICLAGTTTKERLYEDNANRSILIYLDGTPEHKERIMDYQRKLSAGKIDARRETMLKEFFCDMQSVLKPVAVRNPYAEDLKLPEYVFKPLRTNTHYLAMIETITFYHQWQREVKTDASGEKYIETTLEDIQWANRLLKDVLLAKSDELSGECRSFFERLKGWVKKEDKTSFFASQLREAFRMNPSNLKYYLIQLVRYGYLKSVGGDRYKRGFEYEVVNFEDYNKLNTNINNVFDQVLDKIKNKPGG